MQKRKDEIIDALYKAIEESEENRRLKGVAEFRLDTAKRLIKDFEAERDEARRQRDNLREWVKEMEAEISQAKNQLSVLKERIHDSH